MLPHQLQNWLPPERITIRIQFQAEEAIRCHPNGLAH
jgi:hypothetical protein